MQKTPRHEGECKSYRGSPKHAADLTPRGTGDLRACKQSPKEHRGPQSTKRDPQSEQGHTELPQAHRGTPE